MLVRSVTAIPPEIPEKGMKATQYRERTVQILTVIEPCSTEGRLVRLHKAALAAIPQIEEKGDLPSLELFVRKIW